MLQPLNSEQDRVLRVELKKRVSESSESILKDRKMSVFSRRANLSSDASKIQSLKRENAYISKPQRISRTVREIVAQATISPAQSSLEGTPFEESQKAASYAKTTARTTRYMSRLAKKTAQNTAKTTKKAVQTGAKAAKAAVQATSKVAAAAVANPAVSLPIIAVALVILLCVTFNPASSVLGASLKASDSALNQVYLYLTELDCDLQLELQRYTHNYNYEEILFYVNGNLVGESEAFQALSTDPNSIFVYLDIKHEDYEFKDVKKEIDSIHYDLYTITPEEIVVPNPDPDPDPDPPSPPKPPPKEIKALSRATNKNLATNSPQNNNYKILTIKITAQSSYDYFNKKREQLFTSDDYNTFEDLLILGPLLTRQCLYSPFIDYSWQDHVSSRFGWRIHPITQTKNLHQGLDMAAPEGTTIHAVMSGIVEEVGENEGLGKYIIISFGETKTLYAHCSRIIVRKNQAVSSGNIIGFVGSTGTSTGSHLHLEYRVKGTNYNPAFYTAVPELSD